LYENHLSKIKQIRNINNGFWEIEKEGLLGFLDSYRVDFFSWADGLKGNSASNTISTNYA